MLELILQTQHEAEPMMSFSWDYLQYHPGLTSFWTNSSMHGNI